MRTIALLLLLVTGSLHAQAPASSVRDTSLVSGTRARFWRASEFRWIEGIVARVFPQAGVACLGVVSDELRGWVSIQTIDSLQVDRLARPAGPPRRGQAAPSRAVRWRPVPVPPLRARERGC